MSLLTRLSKYMMCLYIIYLGSLYIIGKIFQKSDVFFNDGLGYVVFIKIGWEMQRLIMKI